MPPKKTPPEGENLEPSPEESKPPAEPSTGTPAAPSTSTPPEPETGLSPPEPRKLYRSRKNRIIAGVAGGIGEYLGIDPTIIRLLWILLTLLGGAGIIAYIIAWIVIPERPTGEEAPEVPDTVSSQAGLIIGILLVGLGLWYLFSNLRLIPAELFEILRVIRSAALPLTLILIGVIVIIAASRGRAGLPASGRTLYRSRAKRMVAGVCGGLSDYFGIDVTLIRLAWVAFTIATPVAGIIAYIVAAIIVPEEPK